MAMWAEPINYKADFRQPFKSYRTVSVSISMSPTQLLDYTKLYMRLKVTSTDSMSLQMWVIVEASKLKGC